MFEILRQPGSASEATVAASAADKPSNFGDERGALLLGQGDGPPRSNVVSRGLHKGQNLSVRLAGAQQRGDFLEPIHRDGVPGADEVEFGRWRC